MNALPQMKAHPLLAKIGNRFRRTWLDSDNYYLEGSFKWDGIDFPKLALVYFHPARDPSKHIWELVAYDAHDNPYSLCSVTQTYTDFDDEEQGGRIKFLGSFPTPKGKLHFAITAHDENGESYSMRLINIGAPTAQRTRPDAPQRERGTELPPSTAKQDDKGSPLPKSSAKTPNASDKITA